jgi:hypothetical protein
MSGTVKASSTETAAENKPVYSVPMNAYTSTMNDKTATHENEDGTSILLPALDIVNFFFRRHLRIEGEELPRAITEGRFLFCSHGHVELYGA